MIHLSDLGFIRLILRVYELCCSVILILHSLGSNHPRSWLALREQSNCERDNCASHLLLLLPLLMLPSSSSEATTEALSSRSEWTMSSFQRSTTTATNLIVKPKRGVLLVTAART